MSSPSDRVLKQFLDLKDAFNLLPKQEQDHQLKYHLGSIFIDCPICGVKGRKL